MLGKSKPSVQAAFGQVLRDARLAAGLSQEKLGFEAGVERNFVSLMELGQNQPTISTIFKLAQALNRKPSELMVLVEQKADIKF